MKMDSRTRRGFTVLELLVALAILAVVAAISISGLYSMRSRQALDSSARRVASLVEEARVAAASSKGGTAYGIHFESDRAVLFVGDSYSVSADTNRAVNLGYGVTLSSIVVSGGGSDVVFDRLTGATDDAATTTLSISGSASSTRTIVIHNTGLVDLR